MQLGMDNRKSGVVGMISESVGVRRRSIAPGILLLRSLRQKNYSVQFYKTAVLIVTFVAYACYHASRKPPSIVKSVLDPQPSSLNLQPLHLQSPHHNSYPAFAWPMNLMFIRKLDRNSSFLERYGDGLKVEGFAGMQQPLAGWPPFDGEPGKAKLGQIDLSFLAAYAFGMYFSGHLGDRLDLRKFLTVGMLGSAAFVCLFGFGYFWQIHAFSYYLSVQMMAGLFQATGWPSVVAIMGNWFGKSKRGLIMGIWNAHTSVGNILGTVAASSMLQYGWGWSFLLPGLFMILAGAVVYLFLVVDPSDVDLPSPDEEQSFEEEDLLSDGEKAGSYAVDNTDVGVWVDAGISDNRSRSEDPGHISFSIPVSEQLDGSGREADAAKLSSRTQAGCYGGHEGRPISPQHGIPAGANNDQAVGFFKAWAIPGVAQFAFCLFFSKLVAYTFLYWLPFYIRNTEIAGEYLSDETAGNLSALFDIGGVLGGILAGHISDSLQASATTAAAFTFSAIPVLFLYNVYGGSSIYANACIMILAGALVNGPYALISTAVSADLGTRSSSVGNSKALATVTAIIDGTGSIGAAVGPVLTGYISQGGWNNVFSMLMLAALFAGLLLSNLVYKEIRAMVQRWRCQHGTLTQSLLAGEDESCACC